MNEKPGNCIYICNVARINQRRKTTYLNHRFFKNTALSTLELRLVLVGTTPNCQDEGWLAADDAFDSDGPAADAASSAGPSLCRVADAGKDGEGRDDAVLHI